VSLRLEAAEHPVVGLKRIAREQLAGGLQALDGEGDLGGRVHSARKSLKKGRAVVRLLRAELGEDVFKEQNVRMRDLGRRLAPVRDADIALATIGEFSLPAPRTLRDRLRRERGAARRALARDEELLAELRDGLAEALAQIDTWPLEHSGSELFEGGVRRTYERGRKAFRKAYAKPSPDRFHELRKRVKYLWYFARMLQPSAPGELGELVETTDPAADLLGLDHDLAVLAERVETDRRLGAEQKRVLLRAIEQRRLELEARALPLLRRLFAESPKSFTRRIARHFEAWRLGLARAPLLRLTPEAAGRARGLLASRPTRTASRRKVAAELRELGVRRETLAPLVGVAPRDFEVEHLEELIDRGLVAVGAADALRDVPIVDRARQLAVDAGPNEASGICPIGSRELLEDRGWSEGYWVVLDEGPIERCIAAVGYAPGEQRGWRAERPELRTDRPETTDDGEDCVRVGEWVYALGSHYGSKGGPVENERQFVARFRERDLIDGGADLELAPTGFRLHRALNDALAASGLELFELRAEAREALIGGAIAAGEGEEGDPRSERVEPADLPINVEGLALRPSGTVLLGLRFPVTAEGHPLIAEIDSLEPLFAGEAPEVRGIWVLGGVGNPAAPAGIRALGEGEDGAIDAITGNLDSDSAKSALIGAHPEAARARVAHFALRFPGNRRRGPVRGELVREFPGILRVEGVARDEVGRRFYVADEEEHVEVIYAEPVDLIPAGD
jgi:CHAD domain-containing protein